MQIRALLASGNRDRAEDVLWSEISNDLSPRLRPGSAIWSGSDRERALLWCFVEMQSEATCLRIDPEAVMTSFGVWPEATGGFLVASPEGHAVELDPQGLRPAHDVGREVPSDATAVKATPSGRTFVCWNDREIWTWDRETGERLATIANASGSIALAVTDAGLAISDASGRISVLAIPALTPVASFDGVRPDQTPWLDPSGSIIAFVGDDHRLHVVDMARSIEIPPTGAKVDDPEEEMGMIQLHLTPRMDRMVVVFNGGLVVRDLTTTDDAPIFQRSGYRVWVQHDPAWSVLSAVAHGDPSLRLWSTTDWRPLGSLTGHKGSVVSHAFSADGTRILTIDETGTLRVWASPIASWREVLVSPTTSVHQLAIDPIRGGVILPDSDRFSPASSDGLAMTRAAISEDGRIAARADLEGHIEIVHDEHPDDIRRLDLAAYIAALRFRPGSGSTVLAICTGDSDVLFVDPRTGEIL
ncbi:MAG: WD40 repeat domain-containing protein, partial [Phycisphaerales bacterium]|nr:WD40 repeat domain-containing protein [Phycisphaerales bacterium]